MPLIRYKAGRRYKVSTFNFVNGLCKMTDEEFVKFQEIVNQPTFPARERMQFSQVNEEALATLEKPLAPSAIRGPQQSKDIIAKRVVQEGVESDGQPDPMAGLGAPETQKPASLVDKK
jgi:hypothetical protein